MLGAEPVGGAFGLPAGVELLAFELGLAAAGGEHGFLAAGRVGRAALCVEPCFDLFGSLGEPVARGLRYAVDLGDVTSGPPLHAESFGQLEAQSGLVDLARGLGVAEQVGVHERRPALVAASHQVRDEDVPVQQRVTGPRGAMPEDSRRDLAARFGADTGRVGGRRVLLGQVGQESFVAGASPCGHHVAFEPGERVA